MTEAWYKPGDFVWCLFAFSEAPEKPGPGRHIGYVIDIGVSRSRKMSVVAALYTTTSRTHADAAIPFGVVPFGVEAATTLGQRPFAIDARRIAYMPLVAEFFPEIGRPDAGVVGRASPGFQKRIERTLVELLKRPELLEILGPEKPPSRRS